MLIKKLQINNFGKLKGKEIDLKDGINVIYGENESGKSTLLDFIVSMFYGVSKNKNGRDISNYDKYMPWNDGEFSGKITYELDNRESFEVYRNFTKKNPQIFDKYANDISKEFTVDKSEGNKFFYEQTKVDEELFNMSMVIHQKEVELDSKSQNSLIQKASNIMLTGEDSVSYQKIIGKINKRQTDEIGTFKSPTKPLYTITHELESLRTKREDLKIKTHKKNNLEESTNKLRKEIQEEENIFKALQEWESISKEKKLEEEKINIYENAKNELCENKKELEKELKSIKLITPKGKISSFLYVLPVLFFIVSILFFVISMYVIGGGTLFCGTASLVILVLINLKRKKIMEVQEQEVDKERRSIQNRIIIIESEISTKNKLISDARNNLDFKFNMQKEQIKLKYENIRNINSIGDTLDMHEQQNYINELKVRLNQNDYEVKMLSDELQSMSKLEESIRINEERLKDLLEYNESIEIAKDALNNAYLEMKENVTPRFTENLSEFMNSITCGKYKKVKVNEENGLILETENGNYITGGNLSQGTIDELYLSLRISGINELTEEDMPIILDETFAYFDNSRLENALEFFKSNYKEKQIIILTCTNREMEIMKRVNIGYNKVVLN